MARSKRRLRSTPQTNQTWVFKGAIVSGPGGTESGEVNFEMVYAGEDHSKFMAKETGGDGGNFQVFVWPVACSKWPLWPTPQARPVVSRSNYCYGKH